MQHEMMWQTITSKWNEFWFQPIGTETICLYRILFGALVIGNLLEIARDFSVWYLKTGIVTHDQMQLLRWNGNPQFDLFTLCPNDQTCELYFLSVFLAAVFLCVGFCTRFSAGYVSMGLISLYHHNPFISNGGDAFLRLVSIFMVFAPAGDCYSIDSCFNKNKSTERVTRQPWAQRMIQIQLLITYWGAFWFKASGSFWWDGTAVYYATRLPELMNGAFWLLDNEWFCKIASWSTLLIELLAFTLIWFKPARYYILFSLLLLHVSIMYLFLLPLFQSLFIATLITFVEPDTINKLIQKAKEMCLKRTHPLKFLF